MQYKNENEAYVSLLCGHVRGMVSRLRRMPADQWDWSPDPAAPTARILASHMWQWLVCDRQHILEPDALQHDFIPELPSDTQTLCDELAAEADRWEALLLSLTPEQFDEPRFQFNESDYALNIRSFVCHIIQNSIYKHGQFATLFFALGLDGTEPYDAPFPNPFYQEIHDDEIAKKLIG